MVLSTPVRPRRQFSQAMARRQLSTPRFAAPRRFAAPISAAQQIKQNGFVIRDSGRVNSALSAPGCIFNAIRAQCGAVLQHILNTLFQGAKMPLKTILILWF